MVSTDWKIAVGLKSSPMITLESFRTGCTKKRRKNKDNRPYYHISLSLSLTHTHKKKLSFAGPLRQEVSGFASRQMMGEGVLLRGIHSHCNSSWNDVHYKKKKDWMYLFPCFFLKNQKKNCSWVGIFWNCIALPNGMFNRHRRSSQQDKPIKIPDLVSTFAANCDKCTVF